MTSCATTAALLRDLEISCSKKVSTASLLEAKKRYRDRKQAWETSPDFVTCPRCREPHPDKDHYQGICHRCRFVMLWEHPHHPFTIEMEKHDGFIRK